MLTLSLHGENNFPFRKQRSRIDVELPDGTGDGDTCPRARCAARAMVRPELVFYQSGVDALAGDILGRLALTHEGLRAGSPGDGGGRAAFRWRSRWAVVMGAIERTAEAHANTFRAGTAT